MKRRRRTDRRLAAAFAAASLTLLANVALADEGSWPDLGTPAHASDDGSKDAAVIIGIDEYAFVPHVPGATHNATDWLTYLTESRHVPIDRVQLLRDVQGTREGILKAASQAAKQVQAGGTLWFVFIGHGAPGPDGSDGLLVGADAQQSADSIFARSVTQTEVLTRLAIGPSSAHRVLVVDACFSGRSGSGEALAAGLQPMLAVHEAPVAGAIVMSAGAADQFAGPLPGAGRPAFSYLVLGALRGWAAETNGDVTAEDAVAYSRHVLRTLPLGRLQEPRFAGAPAHYVLAKHATEKAPNLHDIVLHANDPAPSISGSFPFPSGKPFVPFGAPTPTGDEGPRTPGSIHATFSAPLNDSGIWTLHDSRHATLCKLPCTRWVVPGPGFELVRESPVRGESEVHVSLPSETPFREGTDVSEQLVAPRGSLVAGGVLTGVAVASGVTAGIMFGAESSGSNQTVGIILGTSFATVSLVTLIAGLPILLSSHDWRVEATPGSQGPLMLHFSPQSIDLTHGTTRVSLDPGGISGAF